MATALESTSLLLTTQIVRKPNAPSIFHSEFDNFDQFVNTLTGAGSIHTAHGIMMQDVVINDTEAYGGSIFDIPGVTRSKDRSLNLPVGEELLDCFISQRKSPCYPVNKNHFEGSIDAIQLSDNSHMTWVLLRQFISASGQKVPGWAGFVSVTGCTSNKLTTID
ncbi:hypothetical protein ACF0H5_008366 [Mactra antiquata]